jgi:16S rRNA (adenine1518-N6/adenine1519-N6)-dimethyltransferase
MQPDRPHRVPRASAQRAGGTAGDRSPAPATGAAAQASAERIHRFGIRPNRELGQNFLVDGNILDVIGRIADPQASDTVLEVGGGVGVLTEYLASRVGHVHVVEVDAHLRGALAEAVAPFGNVTVHWADAMKLPLAGLDPPPGKVIANLPYGVATAVLRRTIDELPSVSHWVVMVQREVGERLAAVPGARSYGASSVLVQLACEVRVARAVPRTVFHPVPGVDSVLVELRRRGDPGALVDEALRWLVHGAFAHRRKTIAGSLALIGGDGPGRERVRVALESLGHPPDARAQRLSPDQFRALAGLLAG